MSVKALTAEYPDIVNEITSPVEVGPIGGASMIQTGAIWDTGATNSVITASLAAKLGLLPMSAVPVSGVHGTQLANVYYVHVVLNNRDISLNLKVTECSELSSDGSVCMLIGMDVISRGDLAVTNYGGRTTMSFCIPSTQKIDFVKAMQTSQPATNPIKNVGRNDPCPCGSGKKYKHCCGKK